MARKVEPRTSRAPAAPRAAGTRRKAAEGRTPAGKTPAKAVGKPKLSAKPKPASKTPVRSKAKPRAAVRKSTGPATVRRPVAPVTSPEEDALAVEALNRRYYDAFQALDVDRMSKLWWHDAEAGCIHPGWDVRRGIDAILETYGEIFTLMKSIRFALGDVHVRAVGDLAFVTCVENLVSEEEEAGDYLGAVLATNVFERRRGEWRMIHHHASPFASDEGELPEGPLH